MFYWQQKTVNARRRNEKQHSTNPQPPPPLISSPTLLPSPHCSIKPKTTLSPPATTSISTSPSRPPLLSTVRWDVSSRNRLSYYSDLAWKLAEDGRFDDFIMMSESAVVSGVNPSEFLDLLNVELVSKGIVRMIGDGKVRSVIGVSSGVEKLGFSSVELFDRSVVAAVGGELRRIVKCGGVEEVVGLMETLAGFGFSIKELMEPFEIIRNCVSERNPHVAIRYAHLSTHSDELFCDIILEFGKKGDLMSALTVFEASKHNLDCPNMFAYRTIIDVCGLCGDHVQSRSIYEYLESQQSTHFCDF